MLDKLKKSGNQLYIDVSSPTEYRKRCKESAEYNVIYSDDEDNIEEELDALHATDCTDVVMDNSQTSNDRASEEITEEEYVY